MVTLKNNQIPNSISFGGEKYLHSNYNVSCLKEFKIFLEVADPHLDKYISRDVSFLTDYRLIWFYLGYFRNARVALEGIDVLWIIFLF